MAWLRKDGSKCAPPAFGDQALCGLTFEDDYASEVVDYAARGPVTCMECCAIISHVRTSLRGVTCKPRQEG